jgi:hypothetical protein
MKFRHPVLLTELAFLGDLRFATQIAIYLPLGDPYGRSRQWFAQTIGRIKRFPAWQT